MLPAILFRSLSWWTILMPNSSPTSANCSQLAKHGIHETSGISTRISWCSYSQNSPKTATRRTLARTISPMHGGECEVAMVMSSSDFAVDMEDTGPAQCPSVTPLRPSQLSYLAGSVSTNLFARSIQSFNWSSSPTPSGSTNTQPVIGLPVMSNSFTFGSRSASS